MDKKINHYKLIKTYPGSPTLGTKIYPVYEGEKSQIVISTLEVESFPEFWEAIYEEEFKVGDWVTVDKSKYSSSFYKLAANYCNLLKSKTFKISKFSNNGSFKENSFIASKLDSYVFPVDCFRKATQDEIDSLFDKTLTLSNGKKVIVNKGVIKPEGVEKIEADELSNLIKNRIFKVDGYTTTVVDITFNIGCWKNVKLIDIQNILLEAERQKELMKY